MASSLSRPSLLGGGLPSHGTLLGRPLVSSGSASRSMVQSSLQSGGALCEQGGSGAEALRRVQDLSRQLTQETIWSFDNIRQSMEDYKGNVTIANERLNIYIGRIMDHAAEDGQIDIERAKGIIGLTQSITEHHFTLATRSLQLCEGQSTATTENCKRSVATIFLARKQQIELFAQALEVVQQAELSQVELTAKHLDLQLKAEKQLFDQMLEVARLQEEFRESERKHEQESTQEENRHDLEQKKLDLEENIKKMEIEAQRHAEELKTEVDMEKASIEAETKKRQIASEERIGIAEKSNQKIGIIADSIGKVVGAGASAGCSIM